MDLNELLLQIRERPDDGAPRLAYADAVEAEDPERAEFIRVQLRLEDMPYWHPEWYELHLRMMELRNGAPGGWLDDLPQPPGVAWALDRGFPDDLRIFSVTAMRQHGARLIALGPPRVQILNWRSPAALATMPALSAVRDLQFENAEMTDEAVVALMASPHLGPLTRLELGFRQLGDYSLIALAGCERLAGLCYLRLWASRNADQRFTARGIEALAASPHLRSLESLALKGCRLGDGVRRLWRSPIAARLRRLDLSDNVLTAAGLEGLPPVRWLNLEKNRIAHVEPITRLAGLECLDLSHNALDDDAAEALAGAPLRSLREMSVENNLIADPGMLALGQSRTLRSLRIFNAPRNPAREALIDAVTTRFRNGSPPLKEMAAVPAAAADASLVGPVDEAGLVRAIVADPDDLVARRVYADWLEEHGAAELAELVRLICDGETIHDGRFHVLTKALEAAIVAVSPGHAAGVHFDAVGLPVVRVMMRKALTKGLEAVADTWLRRHHVHGMYLQGRVTDPKRLAAIAAFGSARCLLFCGMRLGDAGVTGLAESPHLRGLLELDLSDNRFGPPGLAELFRGGRLTGLCSLDLSSNDLGTEGVRAVAESAAGGGLARLSLFSASLDRTAVAVLAASPGLTQLRHLNLSSNRLDDDAVRLLAESPHLPQLVSLDLSGNQVTDAGTAALIGSALLARLRWLSVAHNRLSDPRPLARALPPGCQLQLSTYDTRAELPAEVAEILGGRLRWR